MAHLICYDIENNYLRTKMGNAILDYGFDRINLSVYLGTIDKKSLAELEEALKKMLEKRGKPNDSLMFIAVTAQQVHNMRVYGKNDLDKDDLAGEKSTLIV